MHPRFAGRTARSFRYEFYHQFRRLWDKALPVRLGRGHVVVQGDSASQGGPRGGARQGLWDPPCPARGALSPFLRAPAARPAPAAAPPPAEDARLANLFQTYLDQEFLRHPVYATQQGNHEYDDRMDDLS